MNAVLHIGVRHAEARGHGKNFNRSFVLVCVPCPLGPVGAWIDKHNCALFVLQ
jgi:hypothetical protein